MSVNHCCKAKMHAIDVSSFTDGMSVRKTYNVEHVDGYIISCYVFRNKLQTISPQVS